MSDQLKKILENFCRLDNVRGAVIMDDQGNVLAVLEIGPRSGIYD